MNTTSYFVSKARRFAMATLALAVLWAFALADAQAANIWDGGGGDANWDTLLNWDDDLLPAGTADVTFGTGFASGSAVDLNGNRTVNSLTINATSAFSLNNNDLTVTNGSITRSGGASGVHTIAGNTILGANGTFANSSISDRLEFTGNVDDGASTFDVVVVGPGTTRFTDDDDVPSTRNSYGGSTTVRSGTLIVEGIATANGDYSSVTTRALGANTDDLNLGDGSTSVLDNITLRVVLPFQSNSMLIEHDLNVNNFGDTTTLEGDYTNSTVSFTRPVQLDKDLTVHKNGNSPFGNNQTRFTNVISGTGGLIKTGNDSSTLGRNHSYSLVNTSNSFSGGVLLEGGSISIENNNVLGSGTIAFDGGVLASINNSYSVDNAVVFQGHAGFGGYYSNQARNITFTDTGDAPLTLSNTTMTVRGNLSLGGQNISIATLNPRITGVGKAITKNGPGTLVFAGANTYDGGTTINEGTLQVTTTGALGTGDVFVGIGTTLDLLGESAIDDAAALNVDYVDTSNLGVVNVASGMTEQVIELIVGGISFPEGQYNETSGTISGIDFSLVFAGSGGGSILVDFQIPEPSTGLMVALGFLVTMKRTRRRRAARKT